ncbi:MAG: glucan biosynthesis protein G, partial [Hyphomicrobiaceae bacterium]
MPAAAMLAALPGSLGQAQDTPKPFGAGTVRELAEALSRRPFAKPAIALPPAFAKLTYDQHRDIRFRADQSIWRGAGLEFELQLLPMGWLFDVPVEINLVEGGAVRQLKADASFFTFGPLVGKPPAEAEIGFAGFRIHGPINRPDYYDEIAVFQGASYFRAVGKGHIYGISARGLAVNTARPGGEEFPIFRSFWVERPAPGSAEIVVHALLDSVSLTGAYRFVFKAGRPTTTDVEAVLFPRKDIPFVGVAPLTSMFLFGASSRRATNDFRPAVHDSEGLSIINGSGERIWRPLTNPKRLQVSAFLDRDPKGFGLIQRDRRFLAYEDLEAHYERRPSLWVEPVGPWGHGTVELIEIPTDEEIHDNIAAFWRPAEPW